MGDFLLKYYIWGGRREKLSRRSEPLTRGNNWPPELPGASLKNESIVHTKLCNRARWKSKTSLLLVTKTALQLYIAFYLWIIRHVQSPRRPGAHATVKPVLSFSSGSLVRLRRRQSINGNTKTFISTKIIVGWLGDNSTKVTSSILLV